MSTAPPGLVPISQPLPGVIRQEGQPSRRERIRALMAGGCSGVQAKRILDAEDRAVDRRIVEEVPLGISRPRVARFGAEQRIRQAMSR